MNGDSVIAGTSESVQGRNLFSYCFNNPINLTDENGNWPQWLKDIGKAVKKLATNIGKAAVAIVNSIEAEAGVGGGLKLGASLASVNVKTGIQMDVINVKYSKKKIELRDNLHAELTAGIGPYKIGPQSSSNHPKVCDSCSKFKSCPNVIEQNTWFEKSHSIELVGFELYAIIGFNFNISFNTETFGKELIRLYGEK